MTLITRAPGHGGEGPADIGGDREEPLYRHYTIPITTHPFEPHADASHPCTSRKKFNRRCCTTLHHICSPGYARAAATAAVKQRARPFILAITIRPVALARQRRQTTATTTTPTIPSHPTAAPVTAVDISPSPSLGRPPQWSSRSRPSSSSTSLPTLARCAKSSQVSTLTPTPEPPHLPAVPARHPAMLRWSRPMPLPALQKTRAMESHGKASWTSCWMVASSSSNSLPSILTS